MRRDTSLYCWQRAKDIRKRAKHQRHWDWVLRATQKTDVLTMRLWRHELRFNYLWKKLDGETTWASIISPRGIYTILTADLLTYIIHHIQERNNTIYLNEYYTSNLSSPPRGYGILYKEGISALLDLLSPHQLKSPAGNPSIHFSQSNESWLEVWLFEFLVGGISSSLLWISISRYSYSFVFRIKFVSAPYPPVIITLKNYQINLPTRLMPTLHIRVVAGLSGSWKCYHQSSSDFGSRC